MLKKILLCTFVLVAFFANSADTSLENFYSRKVDFKSDNVVYIDNNKILSIYKYKIFSVDLLTDEITLVAEIDPDLVQLKRLKPRIYLINDSADYIVSYYHFRNSKYFLISNNEVLNISYENFKKLDVIHYSSVEVENFDKSYSIKLRGNNHFNFSYDLNLVPSIINNDSIKSEFRIKEDEKNLLNWKEKNSEFNRFYVNKQFVTISPNKFRISFLGWTVENSEFSFKVGDYSGLFVFRIIYDGTVNDDSTIYNIDNEGLLVEKELISSEIEVKVKDIKQVGDFKYYHIEYGEDKSGYILEDNIDIK